MTRVVETYLAAIVAHDWDTVGGLVADEVVRIGPYGDTFRGRDAYVSFLAGLMPTLEGYAMDLARVTYVDDGRRAFAELTEHVTLNGAPTVTAEVLVLTLDEEELISRIEIHIRQA
jgi:ketosteroid isomerase-like protein